MSIALLVEDDSSELHALGVLVEGQGLDVRKVRTLADARATLAGEPIEVVLCDLLLPDGKGTELLEEIDTQETEVILITGHASLETAVEALRLGAHDYLTKPVDVDRLKSLLAGVARTRKLKKTVSDLRGELRQLGRFGPLVGSSPGMQRVYDMIERVAPTEATVFLVGESGTGKELVAGTVHRLSQRTDGPYVPINCGALSPTLMESELFGHEKGSFTGATRRHEGYFERSHGGTLFLDEITEMPLELQVKLLRVLETGQVVRVGGSGPLEVDVRVVAATNRDPEQAVDDGKLRQDLLYRLNVFPIVIPPLREREGDVETLAEEFLARLNSDEEVKRHLAPETLDLLRVYDWPGNVRELKNVIHRAFILADRSITPQCLPPEITGERQPRGPVLQVRVGTRLEDVERRLVLATLDQCGGARKRTAELLGISVKTLYNRLKAYEEEEA